MTRTGSPRTSFARILYFYILFETDLVNLQNLRNIFYSKMCLNQTNIFQFPVVERKFLLSWINLLNLVCYISVEPPASFLRSFSLPFNYLNLNIVLIRLWCILDGFSPVALYIWKCLCVNITLYLMILIWSSALQNQGK